MYKKISRLLMSFLIASASILLIVNISHSESVFLKDGSIIEGKILRETDRSSLYTGASQQLRSI